MAARVGALARPLIGLLAVGMVVTLLALPRPDRPLPSATPVELPPGVPQGEGLTGEAAARALAPFDPDRLRCRPLGCERWWSGGRVEQVSPARLQDDLVVAFRDGIAALDSATGDRRWEASLGSLQPDPTTGWKVRTTELVLSSDDDTLLVWAPRGFVQLRDRDGDERWSLTLPRTRRLWAVELAGDAVLVAGSQDSAGGPVEVVAAHDRHHGTVRWRQRVRWLYAAGPDGALVRTKDDRVALLDPATGRTAFHLDVEQPRWVSSVGAFFVARADGRSTLLLDRTTGEVVRELVDVAEVGDLRAPDGSIALLVSERHDGSDEARPAQVVAIGSDGETRWTYEVGCCARLVSSPPGTVAVRTAGGRAPLLLAAEGGEVLEPPGTAGSAELRWLSQEVLVAPGTATALVVDGSGSRIAVEGRNPRIISVEPLIAASRDGLLGIDTAAAAPAAAWSGQPPPRGDRPLAHDPVRDRTPRAR